MEEYKVPILFLALFSIIFICALIHIILKKCKNWIRKYFPVSTNTKDRPGSVDKEGAHPLLSSDEGPRLIPIEVAALTQSPMLLSDPSTVPLWMSDPSSDPSMVPCRSAMASATTPKLHTRRVRFAEEEATYIVSTEIKHDGRFLVATSSWAVDTSSLTPKDATSKPRKSTPPPVRRSSVPACVDALFKAEPGVSQDDTVIMHRLPQGPNDRRASVV